MTTAQWMERHIYGFADLGQEERQAIQDFTMLWSFFESKLLGTEGSTRAIVDLVAKLQADGRLEPDHFEQSFQYFSARYFPGGSESHHFDKLGLRKRDYPDLVRAALNGSAQNPADKVTALLIVVYRLRNNLFHGIKWAYKIQDQRDNFEHANLALMASIPLAEEGV